MNAETLKREIAEAGDMTQEQLDMAAQKLMREARNSGMKGPYYEHMGGYGAHEMKDFNQYSAQDDLRRRQGYPDDYDPKEDMKMVYVTTL